ncbi:MAG: Uma2 family endonuclease [Chloroflexota bacterium]|nr:Uma2 family endonuclease [Chloroflexota bacterium]MDE2961405.1 Uma2 family endonuclease [Chloroflexota bacterium]
MTTANTRSKLPFRQSLLPLPDPPPRHPDEMTTVDQLHEPGLTHSLSQFLGNPDSTLVTGERYIIREPGAPATERRAPDLLIAFGVDPVAYRRRNGYVIAEQGKPPDFVLEVASPSTADTDVGAKRNDYEGFRIQEYWRFDETGEYHGTRLAGDRLVGGRYEPIDIAELSGGALQGYSAVLNLYLRWENGKIGLYDPATGKHIPTYESERAARLQAEAQVEREREARMLAEARVRELESELRRRDNQ